MDEDKKIITEKDVMREIGFYFLGQSLERNYSDFEKSLVQTNKLLASMNITDCKKLEENVFELSVVRPGFLIGPMGLTIEGIQNKIGVEIKIKENVLASLVYPPDISLY